MMRRQLCVPGSSVPCERTFSKAGALITAKRNRLSGPKVSKIMFLKHNKEFIQQRFFVYFMYVSLYYNQ